MEWLNLLRTVAPTLATALGGPIAGVAVKTLSEALLGSSEGTLEEVQQAIASSSPDTLVKLKEIDANFKLKMKELGVNLEKIAADDRNSARNREIQTKDPTVRNLAYAYTVGYFAALYYVLTYGVDVSMEGVAYTLVGVLTAAQMAIMQYYFGSSSSSALKNEILAKK